MGIGKETSKEAGLPIDDKSASVAEGSISDEVIELTRDKKLKFKYGDKVLADKEVVDLINRGEGYQKLQSDNDKQKNRIAELEEQVAFSERFLQEQEQGRKLQEIAKEAVGNLIPKNSVQLDEYGEPIVGQQEQPPIDAVKILEPFLSELEKKAISQSAQMAEKTIREVINRELLQRKQQEDDSAYFATSKKQAVTRYTVKYNDLLQVAPEAMDDINRVVELRQKNKSLDVQLPQYFGTDQTKFRELDAEKDDNENEIAEILVKLEIGNKQATKELEANAVLTRGVNPMAIASGKSQKKPKTIKEMEDRKAQKEKENEDRYNAWLVRQGIL